jgi:hypothetical protein
MDEQVRWAITFYLIVGMALALLVYARKNEGGQMAALASAVLVAFLWPVLLFIAMALGPDK